VEYTTYVLRGSVGSDTQRVVLSLAAELPVGSKPGAAAEVVFGVRDAARVASPRAVPTGFRCPKRRGRGDRRHGLLPRAVRGAAGTYLMRAV